MGEQNLTIDELTTGVSTKGMIDYKDQLRTNILVKLSVTIRQGFDGIVKGAINNCWQGQSRDNFLEDFEKKIDLLIETLHAEYDEVDHRLTDLETFYKNQDLELYNSK